MRSNNSLKISFILVFLLSLTRLSAQDHWVFLKDKCSEQDFFSAAVCNNYIQDLKDRGVQIKGKSKWLNAVMVSEEDLSKVKDVNYVAHIQALTKYKVTEEGLNEVFPYGEGDWQVQLNNIDSLHRKGYTGKGVTIAVFDGGFYNLDSIPGFDSLWMNGQIIASYDFVDGDSMSFKESPHGMQVMGLFAAQYNDSLVGAAPDANYVLARTEKTGSETHQEEFNWIKAMEWADSIGVDIIHSSLGYSLFDSLQGDYSYQDMDGKSTIITIAAELAASKGIFITNSAGNSGNDPWRYITAPCDGAHVLCVGAVDSFRNKGSFSSFGPSADGRVKPDVMAMGVRNTIYTPNGVLRRGSGTSFSGPIMAAGVACLMEAHPSASNQQIFDAIIRSADRYDTPDSAYGYGIPDLVKADSILNKTLSVPEYEALNVRLFPNPANSKLTIVCDPGTELYIYASNGSIIKHISLSNWYNFIEIDGLTEGVYIAEMISENKRAVKRFVKTALN